MSAALPTMPLNTSGAAYTSVPPALDTICGLLLFTRWERPKSMTCVHQVGETEIYDLCSPGGRDRNL